MNKNQIRSGNYLMLLGETRKVDCVFNIPKRRDMYWVKCIGIIETKIIHFKPIPLTQEWLVNFGFINDNGTEYPNYKLSFYTCMWRDGKTNFCNNHGFIKYLKYVHELQNLFYAIEGKELELKTKSSACA